MTYSYCLVVLMLFGVCVSKPHVPSSPCPDVFSYQHDGQKWYGSILVPSPQFGSDLRMVLRMSIGVKLNQDNTGHIDIIGNRKEVATTMIQGGVLEYKVHFPLRNPLPTPTRIKFNGQKICQGPQAPGREVSTIALDHTVTSDDILSVFGGNGDGPEITIIEVDEQDTNPVKGDPESFDEDEDQNNKKPSVGYEIEEETYKPPNRKPSQRPTTEEAPYIDIRGDTDAAEYKCGIPFQSQNPLVVNGEATEKGEWPWIVAMFVKRISGVEFQCGASLISNRHVLTAAHCIQEKVNRLVKVDDILLKLGVFNIQDWADENTKNVEVTSIQLHPEFNSSQVLYRDIAILVMKKYVQYNQYIVPVCLWEGNNDQVEIVGRQGAVVGWGRDENGLRATPEPRKATLPIVSTETCRASRIEFQLFTNEKTLCAGERMGSGPCNGDSGGGLFMRKEGRWVIRGIVSNSLKDPESFNTCNLFEYIIFTDVAKYNTWIINIINT